MLEAISNSLSNDCCVTNSSSSAQYSCERTPPRRPFGDEEKSDELPSRLPLEAFGDIGRDGNGRTPNLVAKSEIA